jgi:hypothetical protein
MARAQEPIAKASCYAATRNNAPRSAAPIGAQEYRSTRCHPFFPPRKLDEAHEKN